VTEKAIPGGKQVTGVIHAGDFGGHWPSKTDLVFTISLTADSVDAVRSSGPARSRPIVNDGTAWPLCRLLRPRTTVESSPPLM